MGRPRKYPLGDVASISEAPEPAPSSSACECSQYAVDLAELRAKMEYIDRRLLTMGDDISKLKRTTGVR